MPADKTYGVRPRDMERWEPYVQGYKMPLLTDFAGDIRDADRGFRVFGRDQDISWIDISGGNLTMTAVDAHEMMVLADILTEQDPLGTDLFKAYYGQTDVFANVWRNRKSENSKFYDKAEYYQNWNTVLRPTAGGPGSFGVYQQSGYCEQPLVFESNSPTKGVAILTDVVKMTSGTYGAHGAGLQGQFNYYNPTQIPTTAFGHPCAGKYALCLELQRVSTTNSFKLVDPRSEAQKIIVSSTNVTAGATYGLIVLDDVVDLEGTGWLSTDTSGAAFEFHAFVTYLYTYTPSTTVNKLVGDGLSVYRRWEVPS